MLATVVEGAIGSGYEGCSQPLPDKVGIIHGKYLLGSNESQLIYLTRASGYRLISMEVLGRVCSEAAKSSAARDAELVAASVPFVWQPGANALRLVLVSCFLVTELSGFMGEAISTADAIAKDPGTPIVVGNPDNWQLLTKFVSSDKEIVKSTKAVDLGHGCLVQVTTKEGSSFAEALAYVPGVKVVDDVNDGRKLVPLSYE